MTELNLEFDKNATKTMTRLMRHYKTNSKAEIIQKALSLLTLAALVDETKGELLARKQGKESTIII